MKTGRPQRALSLITEETKDPRVFLVTSSRDGTHYAVSVSPASCTCPDFIYRHHQLAGGCKHWVAAEEYRRARLQRPRVTQEEIDELYNVHS